MNRLLRFEITDAKIEKLIDDSTALCSFRVISDGENKHSMPMTLDVIKEAAERSLRGKPILANYSYWEGDMEGHKKPEDSDPIGYVIENQIFEYKPVENGKTALFALALLWKRYAPKQLMSIFNGENHSKDISMEISVDSMVDEADKTKGISRFSFLGLCVLGDSYSPASENARATLLTFSEIKEKYEAMFAMESMKINNSKDAAVMSGSWSNPGRKLYSVLGKKSNAMTLYKEAYLVVDEASVDSAPSEALRYPHHVVRNGELVVSAPGVQAAFQRARQQNIATGEVLAHIRKHYKELGLSMENFSTNFEVKEDKQLEEKVMMQEPEEVEKTKPEENEQENKQEEKEDFAVTVSNYEAKIAEYEAKMKDFEAQIAQYACGEKAFQAEIEDLKSYKNRREEEDKKFAVEKLMSDVGEYLPKEKMDEFAEEAKEVKPEEFTAFANKVQAVSFSYAKKTGKETVTDRMAVQLPQEKKDDKWGW